MLDTGQHLAILSISAALGAVYVIPTFRKSNYFILICFFIFSYFMVLGYLNPIIQDLFDRLRSGFITGVIVILLGLISSWIKNKWPNFF
ncbi:hypothetical protein [Solimicrobium silvestre]|uniref:Uncharacterized protein n=1 Tax=Solimicrobium silvestre TaxID=2099400 RepID=A0A2S9H4L9_9BURK|nr:hypothetical protein [Solimicrobium silvestre]PRC94881.1 hypothetical protein S2091_0076 [Solimicrobium silvestre]